jgi:hypothetical protein
MREVTLNFVCTRIISMQKENSRVSVISPSGEPLMPTKASRARRWIKQGKAKSFWNANWEFGVFNY